MDESFNLINSCYGNVSDKKEAEDKKEEKKDREIEAAAKKGLSFSLERGEKEEEIGEKRSFKRKREEEEEGQALSDKKAKAAFSSSFSSLHRTDRNLFGGTLRQKKSAEEAFSALNLEVCGLPALLKRGNLDELKRACRRLVWNSALAFLQTDRGKERFGWREISQALGAANRVLRQQSRSLFDEELSVSLPCFYRGKHGNPRPSGSSLNLLKAFLKAPFLLKSSLCFSGEQAFEAEGFLFDVADLEKKGPLYIQALALLIEYRREGLAEVLPLLDLKKLFCFCRRFKSPLLEKSFIEQCLLRKSSSGSLEKELQLYRTERDSSDKERTCYIERLPDEMLGRIFSLLVPHGDELKSLSLVNRRFYRVLIGGNSPLFLKRLIEKICTLHPKLLKEIHSRKLGKELLSGLAHRVEKFHLILPRESFDDLFAMFPHQKSLTLRVLNPSDLQGLPSGLQSLKLQANFKEIALKDLAGLEKLTSLDLSACFGPSNGALLELAELKRLRKLDLCGRFVATKESLSQLGKLEGLRHLDLSNCSNVPNDALSHLAGLKNLTHLNLSRSSWLTDEGLCDLGQFKRLDRLQLSSCTELTDAGLPALWKLADLTSLDLMDCEKLTDAGLWHLGKLEKLKQLNLSGCEKLTDEGLEDLLNLNNLRDLNLAYCEELTDEGLIQISNLGGLESLNLSGCKKLTAKGFIHLSKLVNLKRLDLADCSLTDGDLKNLAKLTNLRHLNLTGANLTGSGLEHLERLKDLKSLNLGFCGHLRDENLKHLEKFKYLTKLKLPNCLQLTDKALSHIAKLKELKSLDLCGNNLTDAGLFPLLQLNKIRDLDYSSERLTDTGLWFLGRLRSLRKLSLYSCNQLTDKGLSSLTKLKDLQFLEITSCEELTCEGISRLRESLPYTEIS